jgi:hypothetical protein
MMKFLESFDLFGDCEEITRGKFHDETSKMSYLGGTEEERLKIQKIVDEFLLSAQVKIYAHNEYYYIDLNTDHTIFIYSYDDEWYYLEYYDSESLKSKYYKCDGLEGIRKYFKDIFK